MKPSDFMSNAVLQDAVCKYLESICEAAGKIDELDPQFSQRQFGEQLKYARRSRDRLSHGISVSISRSSGKRQPDPFHSS